MSGSDPTVLLREGAAAPGAPTASRVRIDDPADLQRVIDQVLTEPGIDRSTTVIALATQIPHRVVPLARAAAIRS